MLIYATILLAVSLCSGQHHTGAYYGMPAVRREMLMASNCALNVTVQISSWLMYVRDMDHHHRLYAVAIDHLATRMNFAGGVCDAIRSTLQRVTNAHRHTMAQRHAQHLQPVTGDGWHETTRLLRESLPAVETVCRAQNDASRQSRAEVAACLVRVQKQAKRQLFQHYFP